MGKLADILSRKKRVPEIDIQHTTIYNKLWLDRVSDMSGRIVNDDNDISEILSMINENDGHCPSDTRLMCPCGTMRNGGICKCGLFRDAEAMNPHGTSEIRAVKRNE
jgi:hypothetical protein